MYPRVFERGLLYWKNLHWWYFKIFQQQQYSCKSIGCVELMLRRKLFKVKWLNKILKQIKIPHTTLHVQLVTYIQVILDIVWKLKKLIHFQYIYIIWKKCETPLMIWMSWYLDMIKEVVPKLASLYPITFTPSNWIFVPI